jgi:hypothetical protein
MVGYTFISDGGFTASLGAGDRAASSFAVDVGLQLNLGYAF